MNLRLTPSLLLIPALLILTACSNVSEKRSLLTSAGFKTIPATTPAQIERLHAIKSSKVVPMTGKKGTVYVFADKGRNVLFVGSPYQYQQYRALKLKQQKIDEKLLDAQMNMDNADYSAWGEGADWGWGVASDPY